MLKRDIGRTLHNLGVEIQISPVFLQVLLYCSALLLVGGWTVCPGHSEITKASSKQWE